LTAHPSARNRSQITHLCFEADVEPYAKARDAAITAAAAAAGVEMSVHTSHTLHVRVPAARL
jgi:deoxyribodipyrimidine photolyase